MGTEREQDYEMVRRKQTMQTKEDEQTEEEEEEEEEEDAAKKTKFKGSLSLARYIYTRSCWLDDYSRLNCRVKPRKSNQLFTPCSN